MFNQNGGSCESVCVRLVLVSEAESGISSGADATDESALVASIDEGNESALETLYDRYGRQAYALARRIVGDEQLAQDVVQEVFLGVWRGTARYDGGRGGLGTWLLAMTHHKAVDQVRREDNQRRRRVGLDDAREQPAGATDVIDEVWTTLRGERVRWALGELTLPQREALVFAYYFGYTQREIAEATGVPLGTVKTRMMAGVRRLRQCLAVHEVRGEGD